mgnify:CR=1 FL=1
MRYMIYAAVLGLCLVLPGCASQRGLLDVSSTGHLTQPSASLTLQPASGADYAIVATDSGIVSLDVGDGTTTVTLNVPDGARLLGTACKVTTSIADVSAAAVTITVTYTGGSTLAATTNLVTAGDGNVASGTQVRDLYDFADVNTVSGAVANLEVAIAGGVDNTPSAGAVRCVSHYETLGALD